MSIHSKQPMGPAWLLSKMRAVHGTNLIALGEGSGLVLSGSNVTGWTALVGPNLTASGTGSYVRAWNNGRYGLSGPTNTGKRLSGTIAGGYKSATIATFQPPVPFSRVTVGLDGNANTFILGLNSGNSNLFTTTGYTLYVNDSITETVASGFQVISAAITSAADTAIHVGGYRSGASDWTATIEVYAAYTAKPTDAQMQLTSRILHEYCRK